MTEQLLRRKTAPAATGIAPALRAPGFAALSEGRGGTAYALVLIVWVFYAFKPEWTIPGMKVAAPLQTLSQLALLGLWLVSSRKNLKNPLTLYFFLFLLVLTLSTALARNNGIGRDTIRAMFFFFITYITTITFAGGEKKLFTLFTIMILGNLYLALLAIKGGGLVRGASIFSDQNDMALNMNMIWPLALFLGFGEKKRLWKLLYFAAVGVLIAAVIISNSRGGLLGLVAVMLFAWWKLPVSKIKSTFLVCLIILSIAFLAPPSFWDKMKTMQTEGVERGTSASRIYMWKVAFAEFLDNPFIGVGVNNYGVWLPDYVNTKVEFDRDAMSKDTTFYGRVCHSVYFTLLSETGAVGAALFLLMLFPLFRAMGSEKRLALLLGRIAGKNRAGRRELVAFGHEVRKCRSLGLGLTGGLIGFLISGAFITVLYYPQFWLLCTLGVLLGDCSARLLRRGAEIITNEGVDHEKR